MKSRQRQNYVSCNVYETIHIRIYRIGSFKHQTLQKAYRAGYARKIWDYVLRTKLVTLEQNIVSTLSTRFRFHIVPKYLNLNASSRDQIFLLNQISIRNQNQKLMYN